VSAALAIVLWILAVVMVLAGIAGAVLPALPGIPLVFAGLMLGAWADGFTHVGWPTLVVLGVLAAISLVLDPIANALGAKRAGASGWAIAGAAIGTFAGLFLGLPGLVLGPLVGAVVGELAARRDLRQAGRAGLGAWIGFLAGTVAKLAIGFAMVGLFAAAFLF